MYLKVCFIISSDMEVIGQYGVKSEFSNTTW
jgi:hypothetical protein